MIKAYYVTEQNLGKWEFTIEHKGQHANIYRQKDGSSRVVHGNIYFDNSKDFKTFINGTEDFVVEKKV